MAVMIKCKMCGGDLVLTEGSTIATCEYCGTTQTVPTMDNEKKLVQFERAERLRKNCEFDKAAGVYESIVADFRQEAEAYWGMVLCKYGIEYVDDPATGKKIPTCHRSSFESIMDDPNFEQALENADAVARKVYREEAKQIEQIRKGIVAVSNNEEPYDIFICYKETAENGERTIDSVLAQDIYDALIEKNYRVFFSRITLEDKLGQEYEPYIFAALNSAKVMLAIGTDYEYFNAVWVKNEWSRYLKLMEKDKSKHLIPCFKGIDAYDMPKEFGKLQAQDLGKVGAVQDLLRGIDKLIAAKPAVQATAQVSDEDMNRAFLYRAAVDKLNTKSIPEIQDVIAKLESVSNYKDAAEKLQQAQARLKTLKKKRTTKRIAIVTVILMLIGAFAGFLAWVKYSNNLKNYESALKHMDNHQYYEAWNTLQYALTDDDFKDANALKAEAEEKMYQLSDVIKTVRGEYHGPMLSIYGETYFGLVPTGTELHGIGEVYIALDWGYVGPKTALDFKDPAGMAIYGTEEGKAMLEAGELLTDIHGSVTLDPETGEMSLKDDHGNTYRIAQNPESGTVTVSGGLFGSGMTFSNDVDTSLYAYEGFVMAFSGSSLARGRDVLEGEIDGNSAYIYYNDHPLIENGFWVADPETGDVYITGGDPSWMLKLTLDGNMEEGIMDGYTVEVVGSGCPYNIAGYYKLNW